MEKYLVELIKENNRVIMPNFGAFIIGREAGLSILFNNFLTFNDGLLINFVAKEEEVAVETATEKVADFVAHIKSELENSGIFIIAGIGTFTKDGNSIVRFQMEQVENLVKDIIPEQKTKKIENSSDLLDFDATGDDAKVIEVETSVHANVDKEPLLSIDNQEHEEVVVKKEFIASKEELPIVTPQSKIKYENKTAQKKSVKREVKISPLVYVAIALLLLVGAASVWYFYFNTKPKIEPVVVEKQISSVKDSVITTPVVPEKSTVKPAKELTDGCLNRIVVGVFQNAAVADGFVAQLKSRGYNETFKMDKEGAFYVIINSFASLQEAEDFQQIILNDKIESWIITQ